VASGDNAGPVNAYVAKRLEFPATVYLPRLAVEVDCVRSYGADVRLAGTNYADASSLEDCGRLNLGAPRRRPAAHPNHGQMRSIALSINGSYL
jgi:threonine dehydratase